MDYKDQLLTPEWRKKREHILNSRGWKCEKCGSKESLQVHHSFYIKNKMAWEYEDYQLNVLCKSCHHKTHANQGNNKSKIDTYKKGCDGSIFKLGYTKVSKFVLFSEISANAKLFYTILCYESSIKRNKLTYRYFVKKYKINERAITASIIELENIGAIKCRRGMYKITNKYNVIKDGCSVVNIPNCIILNKNITKVEKSFLVCNYNFIVSQKEPITTYALCIKSKSNSFKKTFTYRLVDLVNGREYFKWIIKNDKRISFNIEAIKQLDVLTREELTQLNQENKKL